MIEFISFLTCILIAFGIGSNDTSNSLGICIGSGVIKLKKAVLLFGVSVFIGIFLQGQRVMETVGKDILNIDFSILSISLSVSAFLIILSNWKRLPLSTHQVIIGSLTGSGFASGAEINFLSLSEIAFSWAISPLIASLNSIVIYKIMEGTLSKLPFFSIEKILRILLLIGGILIAYNTGANELATVMGPVIHSGLLSMMSSFLMGAIFVFLGAVLLSHRVIETVGKGITALDPYSGFAAQFGAGSCVLLFTFLGMPVSTTYCIIGGISGVGILKGVETVRISLIKKVLFNWILAPSLAFLISFLVMKVFR
ncbi:MAG: inorganic phosphate transporter [Nitrospirae bacterium]|nr:inorganic phosphate transporter [Nitrospirota bacterium]